MAKSPYPVASLPDPPRYAVRRWTRTNVILVVVP